MLPFYTTYILGNPNEKCVLIKNLKLEMKRHITLKPSYVCYQPRQQQEAVNKYQLHLPLTTVTIKIISNQRT